MQKWEHAQIGEGDPQSLVGAINDCAGDGWELVSVVFNPRITLRPWVGFLKRPVPPLQMPVSGTEAARQS